MNTTQSACRSRQALINISHGKLSIQSDLLLTSSSQSLSFLYVFTSHFIPGKKKQDSSILPDCCASLQASPILLPVRKLNTASTWLSCRDKETSSSIRAAAVSDSQREKALLRSRARLYSLGSSRLASNSFKFPQIASHNVHVKHQCFTTAASTELSSHKE